jgi:hypothetical protein
MASGLPLDPEDLREQRFWQVVVRIAWTIVIVLVALGVMAGAAASLDWQPYLVLSLVGLLAGASLAMALVGSALTRELTGLVLGGITLPAIAVYLAGLATRSEMPFAAYSVSLVPFLAHMAVAVLGGVGVARVWAHRPTAPRPATGSAEAGREAQP